MSGIVVDSVVKTFRAGSVRALDSVSMTAAPGEVCGIIGPNGAGKTTLMGILLGLLRPTSGKVLIDGHPPDHMDVRSKTGYLPERLTLDRWMSGRDFLIHHHHLARLPRADAARTAAEALERIGLGAEAGRKRIRTYSRGMLQRLGLAQALLGNPRYIFLDEPTSGMDPSGVLLFRKLLKEQQDRGSTILLNSHQLDQIEKVCDRVVFVKSGRIESMETLEAGAGMIRLLRIRLAQTSPRPPAGTVTGFLGIAGATLVRDDPFELTFSVKGDETAAQLLKFLIHSGHPVIEAVPEESGLERLFTERGVHRP